MGEVCLSTRMVQEGGGFRARSVPIEVKDGVREGASEAEWGLARSIHESIQQQPQTTRLRLVLVL